MEDKEMMKIIQENHEKEYKKYIKTLKKEKIQDKIITASLIVAMIVIISILGHMNNKAIERCMSKGNSYNYCLVEVNK